MKVLGFRSKKVWKNIVACIYYCILIFLSIGFLVTVFSKHEMSALLSIIFALCAFSFPVVVLTIRANSSKLASVKKSKIFAVCFCGTIMLFFIFIVQIIGTDSLNEDNKMVQSNTNSVISSESNNVKIYHIIGSTKDEAKEFFKDYKIVPAYTQNVDAQAIKFENNNLIIVVDFDSNGKAEGVSFLSENRFDRVTGNGSYVSENYDKLVNLATDNKSVKIVTDMDIVKEVIAVQEKPVEIYIGNLHE